MNKLSDLVGVTLGPKGRNVVLESKYGAPKIVNDGVTVAKEVWFFPHIVKRLASPVISYSGLLLVPFSGLVLSILFTFLKISVK